MSSHCWLYVFTGIETATEELKKESEEALWEEGILRRVPVVGTFVNWFSPPTKETGVKGRALNLTQGKVESTENIYKYHMQIESSSSSSSNTSFVTNTSKTGRKNSNTSVSSANNTRNSASGSNLVNSAPSNSNFVSDNGNK